MSRNMRIPRLSKIPPSVKACRPKLLADAPTSELDNCSGGKNPGKADEAATPMATVAKSA